MTAAKPNVDVLAIVCEFVTDISDVLSFTLTCSALRPAATTRLLSMRPISLEFGPSVRRFHSFLFADVPARAPHIHVVGINLEGKEHPSETDRNSQDASLLIDILAACHNLQWVFLAFDRLLWGDSEDMRIMDALAALRSLRELTLYGPSADALPLVQNVRAPLRALSLHQCDAGDTLFWHPAALERSLYHLAPTLEKLDLYQFILDPDVVEGLGLVLGLPGFGRTQAQFRAIRSLSMVLLVGTPLLSRLQHLFPALDGTLSLDDFAFEDANYDDMGLQQAYTAVRAANQRAQDDPIAQASDGDASNKCVWTKLNRVVCNALLFYLLGLRCQVQLAMLDVSICHSVAFSQAARLAMEALRANPVPRLKLSLVLNDGLGVFHGLFSPELGARLTHLTLCLVYTNDRMWRDMTSESGTDAAPLQWDDLLGTLCTSLQPLRELAYLRLFVHSNAFDNYAPQAGFSPAAHSREFVHALCGPAVDPEATAAALVRSLPSLRYLFLTTSGFLPTETPGHGENDNVNGSAAAGSGSGSESSKTRTRSELWQVARAWRVAAAERSAGTQDRDRDGGPVLVELHDDVAETITWNEELFLSALDTTWILQGGK